MNKVYVAFLRGINIGPHHKVPMSDLKNIGTQLGFSNMITFLNSGNLLFTCSETPIQQLELQLENALHHFFGFKVPTVVMLSSHITDMVSKNPFNQVDNNPSTKCYISLLKKPKTSDISLPWQSNDKGVTLLESSENYILSILDLSINNSPKGMEMIEKMYGKDLTTRNWNTILRIHKKLESY